MEKINSISSICLLVFLLSLASLSVRAQDFETLPDGTTFPFWSDLTKYDKIYHVAQNNPRASDENSGTQDRPFKTINAAARLLKPGEKVIVHEGTYRECIRPARGGTSADKMISYEAAAGEKVIIKGSEIWKPDVKPSSGWNLRRNESGNTIWMADIPEDFFKAYNPFAIRNAYHYLTTYGVVTDKEWMNRALLFRGMVFVDGKPLKQVYQLRELNTTTNAFWVEDPGLKLHFRLDDDPSKHLIEITTREQIFAPRDYGIGYIHIKGFIFEHAADGLPVPQRAAVSTMRGHHWIIENNSIEWANACGLDIGAQSWDAIRPDLCGHHIVLNNKISNCGIAGIAGARGVEYTLIEGNLIEKIGFQNLERMWECAGIKFHFCKNSLFRGNIIRNLTYAAGLWLDVNNANCRITNNVFANISAIQGGLFSEMNYDLNLVDHNIFWDIRNYAQEPGQPPRKGNGAIHADGNERLVVANNFFGKVVNCAVSFNLNQKDRRNEGRTALSYSNVAVNNVFYQCGIQIHLARHLENKIDGNLYDQSRDNYSFILEYPEPINYQHLAGWQEFFGLDKNSTQAKIEASFDIESCILKVKIEGKMPNFQMWESFMNGKTTGNYPGPFRATVIQEDSRILTIEQKFPIVRVLNNKIQEVR